jgi:hypothetical protein
MLKDKIKKKFSWKRGEKPRVNSSNPQFKSWDWKNLIKSKLKKNYETQSPINPISKNEIEI